MPTFKELGLSEKAVAAITELGYKEPTPIQEQAIPVLLRGADVIGQAQTGTGKTAAFGLPLLETIDTAVREVQALVLTPTRELCIQVTQALRAYGESRGIDVVGVFGGAPIRSQQAQLRAGGQVVVGTVGRVLDLISRHSLVLHSTRFVVLDEADEMLDLGFLEDVEAILRKSPNGRQTALFSATMPEAIKRLAQNYMFEAQTIKVQALTLTIDTVEHFYLETSKKDKPEALAQLIKAEKPNQAIIFVRTKISAEKVKDRLDRDGASVKALHGDLSQGQRDGVMIGFKDNRVPLLVATDIAARGLDVEHVTHVINYDVPGSAEAYTHRIGRTGRVGRSGRAITLIEPSQRDDLTAIEKHTKMEISAWAPGGGSTETLAVAAKPADDDGSAAEPPVAAEARSARKPRERAPQSRTGTAAKAGATEAAAPDSQEAAADAPESATDSAGPKKRAARPRAAKSATDETAAEVPAAEPADAVTTEEPVKPKPRRRTKAAAKPETTAADSAPAEPEVAQQPERQMRRPRHTKPVASAFSEGTATLLCNAGARDGVVTKDLVRLLATDAKLANEHIHDVRVHERFSLVRVPREQADEIVKRADGNKIDGRILRVGLAGRT